MCACMRACVPVCVCACMRSCIAGMPMLRVCVLRACVVRVCVCWRACLCCVCVCVVEWWFLSLPSLCCTVEEPLSLAPPFPSILPPAHPSGTGGWAPPPSLPRPTALLPPSPPSLSCRVCVTAGRVGHPPPPHLPLPGGRGCLAPSPSLPLLPPRRRRSGGAAAELGLTGRVLPDLPRPQILGLRLIRPATPHSPSLRPTTPTKQSLFSVDNFCYK